MAQTRKRRQTKHRGNAVGMIEARGRTGRKPDEGRRKPTGTAAARRMDRADQPPTLRSAVNRAAFSAVVLFALLLLVLGQSAGAAFGLATIALIIYIPVGYFTDSMIYKRRMARRSR